MIFKKRKDEDGIKCEELKSESQIHTIPKPKICLFDFDEVQGKKVKAKGYNIESASLGRAVLVPNKSPHDITFCLPNQYYPDNIHEFDIIVFDLKGEKPIPYKEEDHSHEEQKNHTVLYILSKYPQTIFEPRPLGGYIISSHLAQFMEKKSIIIVFASKNEEIEYQFAVVKNNGYYEKNCERYDTYSFMDIRFQENLSGEEVEITIEHPSLRRILERIIENVHYEVTFYHPTVWKGQKSIETENFFPIMKNKHGDIISYCEFFNDSMVFVFPQVKEKATLLLLLLEEFLPEISPELFPYSTMFSWKNESDYYLPEHQKLLDLKDSIEKEYREKLSKIDLKIKENLENYSFLHDLIIETGDKLVDAVKKYLECIGFTNVKKMDTNKIPKEEDLQVQLDDGLLVIEVKGIAGTSKDSDCSQINKIKYRRAKERKKFDVYGLYIVNHQRYLPPRKRNNPPFTKEQITDAENEERGLLTTWEIFNSYKYILNGIITKEEVQKWILDYGLVQLIPKDLVLLGKASEVYKNGHVVILDIENQKIKVGEKIFIFKDDEYQLAKIIEIRFNDVKIDEIDNGEVGIEIDIPIKKNSLVYKKP